MTTTRRDWTTVDEALSRLDRRNLPRHRCHRASCTYEYGTDATGSRAHWYRGGMTLAEAQASARAMIRYPGDTAILYRTHHGPLSVGPSEVVAAYHIDRDNDGPALYVRLPLARVYRVRRITRTLAARWRVA